MKHIFAIPKDAYCHANAPGLSRLDPTKVYDAILADNLPECYLGAAYFKPDDGPEILLMPNEFHTPRRMGFDFTAECGTYVCDDCGRPYYPMEVETEDGEKVCPDCLGNLTRCNFAGYWHNED